MEADLAGWNRSRAEPPAPRLLSPQAERRFELAEVVERLHRLPAQGAGLSSGPVAAGENHQFVEVLGFLQAASGPHADRSFHDRVTRHVVLDEPRGALRDESLQRPPAPPRRGRSGSIPLPTSCSSAASRNSSSYGSSLRASSNTCRLWYSASPFRVILGALLDVFQRQQQRLVHLEAVDLRRRFVDGLVEFHVGVFGGQQLFEFGDRRPFDRLARDRTLEDVELAEPGRRSARTESDLHVDVRETRSTPCLCTRLRSTSYVIPSSSSTSVTASALSENTCRSMSEPRRMWPVITLPISRGRNGCEESHQPQGLEPHVAQVVGPRGHPRAAGQRLQFVADFGVAGQVRRFHPLEADSPSRFHLGLIVFRHLPVVHQASRFPGNLTSQLRTVHDDRAFRSRSMDRE